MTEVLLRERKEGVETLTINRPEKRNALDLEVIQALHLAVDELRTDRDLRTVILTGAGDNFVAGADIGQLRERRSPDALDSINGSLFRRVEELPIPVIAAIRGFALGGGCELAMACDIRVAGKSARLGQPEVGLGIIPGAGATHRLPRLVGMGRAKELIFTGRILEAGEALEVGLVNRVVEDDEVMETARGLATTIGKQGATAIRIAKLALNAQRHELDAAQTLESVAQALLFESEEKESRMAAFLERRK